MSPKIKKNSFFRFGVDNVCLLWEQKEAQQILCVTQMQLLYYGKQFV